MSDRVRIADLPTSTTVDKDSYMLVERPGVGVGTYKTTLGDIQEAITVRAKVTQEDKITKITVKDITGETGATIITPTARIDDNGDNTYTITITDTMGTTTTTAVSKVVFDPRPIEGSSNLLSSGAIYTIETDQESRISEVEQTVSNLNTSFNILSQSVNQFQQDVNEQLQSMNQTMNNRLSAMETEINSRFASMESTMNFRFNEMSNTIDTKLAEMQSTINDQLADMEETMSEELEAMQSELDTKFDTLHSEIDDRLQVVEEGVARAIVVEQDQPIDNPYSINGQRFDNLKDAILAGSSVDTPVKLFGDAESSGISIPSGTDFTLDLNGYDLEMIGPGSGSPGTETLCMQLLKDTNVTIKNGKLIFTDDPRLKMGIQNYSNLTLDNVEISGPSNITYLVSNNYGNVTFKNNTKITAIPGQVAFDGWYGMSAAYDSGVNIIIEDDTVEITGTVEFGKANRASLANFKNNASITTPLDFNLDLSLLTVPCDWIDNGDGTQTLRYSGEV